MSLAAVLARARDEAGVTVVELSITLIIAALVSGMALSALLTGTRAVGQVDDEARGLADLQTVVERLGRDLRAARGVDASSNQSQLTIWIDHDSDYTQAPAETITWTIEAGADVDQYDVVRSDGAGNRRVIGYSLVSAIAFSYSPQAPPKSQVVHVDLNYDAYPRDYASDRVNSFEIRMRNVQ